MNETRKIEETVQVPEGLNPQPLPPGNYVVMDLEWNQPRNKWRVHENGVKLNGEIIEIGAARISPDCDVVETFREYIKPKYYTTMNKIVTDLTDITDEMIDAGKPLEEVVSAFLAWCGPDCKFITWSGNDIIMLEDNMLVYGMSIDDLPWCYDVQQMFDDQITQEGREYALSYAMWKFGIKPQMSHDALNDAVNTAAVMKYLDLSEGLDAYEV